MNNQLLQFAAKDLHKRLKAGAKKRGISWRLDIDDIVVLLKRAKGRCMVTGTPLTYQKLIKNSQKKPFAPSLDRIDSSIGYTPSNCRIVCVAANFAMNQWGEQVLSELAINMYHSGKLPKHKLRCPKRVSEARRNLMPEPEDLDLLA